MSSIVKKSRGPTFPAASGAENVHANEMTNRERGGSSKVRWNVPAHDDDHDDDDHSAAQNNNHLLDTSIAASASMTPSKRIKDRFAGVALGKENDAVFSYHFEGTPFSHKKKRRKHHNSHGGEGRGQQQSHHQNQQHDEETTNELEAADALDNTFQLGGNATAEISAINSMFAGDIDDSMFSMGSKSSRMSNASSGASSAASSEIDLMNCTTRSDTHELSTSNFIQNTKMRNLLAERSKDLFKQSKRASNKAEEGGKKKAPVVLGKKFDGRKGEGEMTNSVPTGIGASSSGGEASTTLSDISLNLDAVLTDRQPPHVPTRLQGEGASDEDEFSEFASHQRPRMPRKSTDSSMLNSSEEDTTRSVGGLDTMFAEFDALARDVGDAEDQCPNTKYPAADDATTSKRPTGESALDEDEILEFTSHQRPSTPLKSNDVSLLNSTISEDTRMSSGGIDRMLADFGVALEDDGDGGSESEGEKNSAVALVKTAKGRKDSITMDNSASNLSKLTENGSDTMHARNVEGKERVGHHHQGDTSFVESTASQNDLNDLFGVENERDGKEELGSQKKIVEDTSYVNSSTASQNHLNNVLDDDYDGVEDNPEAKHGSKRTTIESEKHVDVSFSESTASQNDLNSLLGKMEVENTNDEEVGENDIPKEKALSPTTMATDRTETENQIISESTPLASQPRCAIDRHAATPIESSKSKNNEDPNLSTCSSICPSPSFLSGKKPRVGGISMLRKSLGGDVTRLRKLTASLKKEKKRRKRMSMGGPTLVAQQQAAKGRSYSLGVKRDTGTDGVAASLGMHEPALSPIKALPGRPPQNNQEAALPQPARKTSPKVATTSHDHEKLVSLPLTESPSKEAGPKSPPKITNSPARNTRSAARKSPSKKSPAPVDSPARNTRRTRKSPVADSPARNTRGAKKATHSSAATSPARNTRMAKKSPSRSPCGASSPTKNTRSINKSPRSPGTRKSPRRRTPSSPSPSAAASDSPARNTRSANRIGSPRQSPARSLFRSPSEIDIFQEIDSKFNANSPDFLEGSAETSLAGNGPYKDRKRDKSDDPPTNIAHEELTEPPAKKRLSISSDTSETSLSKEYPFLSLSPHVGNTGSSKMAEEKSPSLGSEYGTQTLMFDELMQGIQNEVGKAAPKKNDASLLEEEEEEKEEEESIVTEIEFRSKQTRNKRRETADATELMGILSEGAVQQDDNSPNAAAKAKKDSTSPCTPGGGAGVKTSNKMPKTPKSILSSSKKRGRNRSRRNVEFGAPEAAEYNIGSPSGSMTPMHPKSVRERYLVPSTLYESESGGGEKDRAADRSFGLDEHTEELEGDLDRLISKGNDTSIMMDPIDELGSNGVSGSSSSDESSFLRAEKTQELETNILNLVDDNRLEESGGSFSLPSISGSVSSAISYQGKDSINDSSDSSLRGDSSRDNGDNDGEDMSIMEPTKTMELKGTIVALLNSCENDVDASAILGEDTRTMELEGTLGALFDDDRDGDVSAPRRPVEETQTMQVEGTLGALIDERNDEASAPPAEESQTLELEGTLAALLDSRKNVIDASAILGEDTRTMEIEGTLGALFCDDQDAEVSAPSTQMTQLEGELGAPLDDRNGDASVPFAEESQTLQLEGTLAALLEDRSRAEEVEEVDVTLPSIGSSSTPPPRNNGLRGIVDLIVDESQTKSIEKADPGNATNGDLSTQSQTMPLDSNLRSLLEGADSEHDGPLEDDTASECDNNTASHGLCNKVVGDRHIMPREIDTISELNMDDLNVDELRTRNIEGSMASLLEASPDDAAGGDLSAQSHTMPLDNDLGALLEGAGAKHDVSREEVKISEIDMDSSSHNLRSGDASNRHIMPREMDTISELDMNTVSHELHNGASERRILREDDTISELGMHTASHELRNGVAGNRHIMSREMDTISELGMNTASHELRTEKKLPRGLTQEIFNNPPDLVDLKLEEVIGQRDINWNNPIESHRDIFLNALNVASANAKFCPSIKPESEKVLTQICEDIESQLSNDNNQASIFRDMIDNNEELMRSLQQNLRSKEVSGNEQCDLKNQARLVLQSSNKSQLAEWGEWLTDVTAVYNDELSNAILHEIQRDKTDISEKTSLVDQNREQIALPLLIKSARRATKRNFNCTKGEVLSCEDEVLELEAQVKEAESQLETARTMHGRIHGIAKSNEKSENLRKDEKDLAQTTDSSYYKFFSVERLHNWVLTGSSDSSISLVFRGVSVETSIQLSFCISSTLTVSLSAKFDRLPRSMSSFLSLGSASQTRFHPAVSGFLKAKMNLLCRDMKNGHISNPTEIPSMIHFAELRVARIEEVAKEIEAILGRCKNSFLQPSESHIEGYDFTAYLTSASKNGDRLHVTLSIQDSYPFAPIGIHLQSASSLYNTEGMTRQLRKASKPGFGALTRAVDALQSMLH